MRKFIVTTTINGPTKAIELFQEMKDWELVVIGDLKTPQDYCLRRGTYMSPKNQEEYNKELSDLIGWNCIQRRNFGLLWAYDHGAYIVAVVDDDNIPYPEWGSNLLVGREAEVNYYVTDLPAFDPVGATNHHTLWHRGYPLQLLSRRDYSNKGRRTWTAQIQADFWNGDPDIDAICRMEHAPNCNFETSAFPIASNKLAPFNSQNTFLTREVLHHYFLFPHIGRMDDIWAAYYVQAKGYKVVFGKASVFQERNVHDLIKDMKAEYLGYEHNLKIVSELAHDPEAILRYLPGRSAAAFQAFKRHMKNE